MGEFDGMVKYGKDYLKPGEVPVDVVIAEKLREDRLRDRGLDVGRWIYQDLRRNRMLRLVAARLNRAGISTPS